MNPSLKNSRLQRQPIGVFDSGLGGLTVVNQLMKHLPGESIIYFGDTARVPYGSKSPLTIQKFSQQIVRFLQNQGVKLIVVACNTASSVALDQVKESSSVSVIDVIEPGARAALRVSVSRRIGIIGTTATISAGKYEKILKTLETNVSVFSQACPLFVPLVEEGWIDSPVTEQIAKIYLNSLMQNKIDSLILGCTHYPIIKEIIKKIVDGNVQIIDSAIETAVKVRKTLKSHHLLNEAKTDSKHLFYVSDFPQKFAEIARRLLGQPLMNVHRIALDDSS
ncbi:MAG: glutamate racemase [Candidatus Marinimicrobia bacterium]|nr:glutamate racemase [Candidatus Neomarinimicrobiota bacterium]